jgi:branched-chain amino acid aminotransferase
MKNFIGCFLTGTAAEITPVAQINNYNFTTCDIIAGLNAAYQVLVRKKTAA